MSDLDKSLDRLVERVETFLKLCDERVKKLEVANENKNISRLIINLTKIADKANNARISALESKVQMLELNNLQLENENAQLRNYVEYTQKIFSEMDLSESKKE